METDIRILYSSDFYRILDFKSQYQDYSVSKAEYSDYFSLSFIRTGYFEDKTYIKEIDAFTGQILVSKPDYEQTVMHFKNALNECTVIEFTNDFYNKLKEDRTFESSFFSNKDVQSVLAKSSSEVVHLHGVIFYSLQILQSAKLKMDDIVVQIFNNVLNDLVEVKPNIDSSKSLKRNHRTALEKAKAYIAYNFRNDISLYHLAKASSISLFQFSRIFKALTGYSPYDYLVDYRLKYAERLLRITNTNIADVAYLTGFNSIVLLNVAFEQKYKVSPEAYKDRYSFE
jgi:AraC-like DNA-binding protein